MSPFSSTFKFFLLICTAKCSALLSALWPCIPTEGSHTRYFLPRVWQVLSVMKLKKQRTIFKRTRQCRALQESKYIPLIALHSPTIPPSRPVSSYTLMHVKCHLYSFHDTSSGGCNWSDGAGPHRIWTLEIGF